MTTKTTPMMAQWAECKKQAGEAILFFRLGDFYEAFNQDAIAASQALDLTLTKRQEIPMCGIPWHSSEAYIDRLLVKGFSIAIAEQIPSDNKALMDRKIVRILTPATAMQGSLVKDSSHSLLASISKVGSQWGVSLIDVTTALFQVFEVASEKELLQELYCLQPREILISTTINKQYGDLLSSLECKKSIAAPWTFDPSNAESVLKTQCNIATLDGFGLQEKKAAISAAGAVIAYLKDTLLISICHLRKVEVLHRKQHMVLDGATLHNLDIIDNGSKKYSLYSILNQTSTPMGARLLRTWLLNPLLEINSIQKRERHVADILNFLRSYTPEATSLFSHLSSIRDLERLILRIQTGNAGPRDILFLAQSCQHIHPIKEICSLFQEQTIRLQDIPDLEPLITHITKRLNEEPPIRISDGGAIREGVDGELDDLRKIQKDSRAWLLDYQNHLREELGIKTLKVGYSRAFGFYIDVSRGQAEKMPSSFARRQTLTNNERYISEELKQYENKVLTAEKKIESLETALFEELKTDVIEYVEHILYSARLIAEIDVYSTFALLAKNRNYVCPTIVEEPVFDIIDGRHPIAEIDISTFVSNNLQMNSSTQSMLLITGPNMAGKSTYVRQSALLILMAQIGSFVPAKSATIGIVDRIFSRVGASDDLSRGQSTFMVEMAETASILHQATSRSLILLDEIGRGTSTYDGISIAWAVVEFLLRFPKENPRTLFATHYYELTDLEKEFPSLKNVTVAISEYDNTLTFLYKIVGGAASRSYGIHVAELAGLPEQVVQRAKEVLATLEKDHPHSSFVQQEFFIPLPQKPTNNKELACYEFLEKLDLVQLTPLDCFMKLAKFQKSLQKK